MNQLPHFIPIRHIVPWKAEALSFPTDYVANRGEMGKSIYQAFSIYTSSYVHTPRMFTPFLIPPNDMPEFSKNGLGP